MADRLQMESRLLLDRGSMDVLEMFVGVRQVLDICAIDGCSIVDGIAIDTR